MTLAVQDWRASFLVSGIVLTVIDISSGYTSQRMAEHLPDPLGTLRLHREFRVTFS